ncbi:MAG: hypothetical protein K2O96_02465, partial [Lachnospiraceae bacterium]|nr:hypothetical protein [Lachnospiraceae bacterium]
NACGDSRLRGLRSRKPIGFRRWVVHEFCMAVWYQQGKELAFETILKIAWSYAREIEHSDYNLVTLDEIFSDYMI